MKNKERYPKTADAAEAYKRYVHDTKDVKNILPWSYLHWLDEECDFAYELLPCPFCGGKPKMEAQTNGCVWVRCGNSSCPARLHVCVYSGLQSERVQDAIAKWNTRKGVSNGNH